MGSWEGLSQRFLAHTCPVLERKASLPTSEAIATWRSLPATGDEDMIRATCLEIQEFAIDGRRWLFAVGTRVGQAAQRFASKASVRAGILRRQKG